MEESEERLLRYIRSYQESLDKYTENRVDEKLLYYIEKLNKLPIKVSHLEETGVGRTVNGLRKMGGEVSEKSKSLVQKWKKMVVTEECESDEDSAQDSKEAAAYSGNEEKHRKSTSHRDSDTNRTESKESKKSKHSSSKSDRHKDSPRTDKSKDNTNKINGHSSSSSTSTISKHQHKITNRQSSSEIVYVSDDQNDESSSSREFQLARSQSREKSQSKRKIELDSSEDDEMVKLKNDRKKSRHDDTTKYDDAEVAKSSKMKSSHHKHNRKDKHRKDDLKHSDGSSKKHTDTASRKSSKDHNNSSKEKMMRKDEDISGDKQHKSSRSKKDGEKTGKSSKSKSSLETGAIKNGIDSGSGASFAEALGMCGSSTSSKGVSALKRKPGSDDKIVIQKEKPATVPLKIDENILLKEQNLEPLDINISSLLPAITPNYRPLGFDAESAHKRNISEYEQLSNIITSKTQRTKVYSGNKTICDKVPSLLELCVRILQDNIDALEFTGGVPYTILKPILDKASAEQLDNIEYYNAYLLDDTDELWQMHCERKFRNKRLMEFETWRDMYRRCLTERDAKLEALTANIKQAQAKSIPVRTTKLAYVDDVAKPPRNIARKQAKNGTGFEKKPSITPSSRLSSIAVSGEAGKIAVPNPGARAAERSSSGGGSFKPKKAPLMAKSLSLMKNRFKR